MTPERVREIATTHAYGCGIDSSGTQLVTYRMGDVERAIRQAVNEALEEAAKLAKARDFREYAGADSAFMEGRYDAAGEIYNAIRALKLPEDS